MNGLNTFIGYDVQTEPARRCFLILAFMNLRRYGIYENPLLPFTQQPMEWELSVAQPLQKPGRNISREGTASIRMPYLVSNPTT